MPFVQVFPDGSRGPFYDIQFFRAPDTNEVVARFVLDNLATDEDCPVIVESVLRAAWDDKKALADLFLALKNETETAA